MVTYGIGVILLIKQLKAAYHDVMQPWYSEDVVALGTYKNINLYFNLIKLFGPGCGYYSET